MALNSQRQDAVAQTLPPSVINAPPEVIGDFQSIGSNTTLNVFDGGSVGFLFAAGLPDGSSTDVLVNVNGGSVGVGFDANSGSTISISGGYVGASFDAKSGSLVAISGGSVAEDFDAESGSKVNLHGSEFNINSVPVDLELGIATEISSRELQLSGQLADETTFEFDLLTSNVSGNDYFSPDATLTVTLVLPGDFNLDGQVDTADYAVWRNNLGAEDVALFTAGDGNGDGRVTQADYDVWREHYGEVHESPSAASPAPEPTAVWLLLGLAPALLRR